MRVSISVATTPSAMPQIMFAGHFEDHCRLLAAMGYENLRGFIWYVDSGKTVPV